MMPIRSRHLFVIIGFFFFFKLNGNSQVLHVGANYHPHDDKDPEKVKKDIQVTSRTFKRCIRDTCWQLYRNMDARIVEISKSSLNYKILFVPGVAVMDEATAAKICNFV
ncbi:MAG TPA: hypothetical protein VF008_02715 [Niastella sp.]